MRFDLEPGDTACNGGGKLVAVKINNEERINLPIKSYYYFDSKSSPHDRYFTARCFGSIRCTVFIYPLGGPRLKLEGIKDNYKLVLTDTNSHCWPVK